MRVIQKQAGAAQKILGKQTADPERKLRPLTYCVYVPCEEGILAYNVLTKEMLLLEPDDIGGCGGETFDADLVNVSGDTFRYLSENWYLVSEDTDDKELALNLRALAQRMQRANAPKGFTGFTILTTTDCNARCFYCYEKDTKRQDMSRETALDTVDFICKNWESVQREAQPGTKGKAVSLRWFGGEPLYNAEIIDLITGELAGRGVPFRSGMVSNGYLFDDEVVRRAANQWNLRRVQITLDGSEEIYNRTKAYVDPEGSAFARVTDNIRRLLDAGIAVTIRMSLDDKNYEDLTELTEWLIDRFSGYDKFRAYAAYLFRLRDGSFREPYCGDEQKLCEQMSILQERLRSAGVSARKRIRKTIRANNCMADSDTSVLIQTDGSLGKCEHFYDSMACGTVRTGITDPDKVSFWKRTDPGEEACDLCPVYPDCFRLSGCQSAYIGACQRVPAMREDLIRSLRRDMLQTYHRSKENSKT